MKHVEVVHVRNKITEFVYQPLLALLVHDVSTSRELTIEDNHLKNRAGAALRAHLRRRAHDHVPVHRMQDRATWQLRQHYVHGKY